MSQGLARTREEIINWLANIKPYLQTGVSVKRAVDYYNSDSMDVEVIVYRTLMDWLARDKNLRKKVKAWQDFNNIKARVSVVQSFDAKPELAFKWLERREKKHFAEKVETDNSGSLKIEIQKKITTTKFSDNMGNNEASD